jgi:hypothetical protein
MIDEILDNLAKATKKTGLQFLDKDVYLLILDKESELWNLPYFGDIKIITSQAKSPYSYSLEYIGDKEAMVTFVNYFNSLREL